MVIVSMPGDADDADDDRADDVEILLCRMLPAHDDADGDVLMMLRRMLPSPAVISFTL